MRRTLLRAVLESGRAAKARGPHQIDVPVDGLLVLMRSLLLDRGDPLGHPILIRLPKMVRKAMYISMSKRHPPCRL